jgi:hypothetical protein
LPRTESWLVRRFPPFSQQPITQRCVSVSVCNDANLFAVVLDNEDRTVGAEPRLGPSIAAILSLLLLAFIGFVFWALATQTR